MKTSEKLALTAAGGLALAILPNTVQPAAETTPSVVTTSPSEEGRTYVDSDMRFAGAEAPYLLGAYCQGGPGAAYNVEYPVPDGRNSSPLTVGATVEGNVDPLSSGRMNHASFIGGVTFVVTNDGAVEFVRSDVPAGYATRINYGSDSEYISLPGEADLEIDFGVTPGSPSVSIAVECIPKIGDDQTQPLELFDSVLLRD